MVLSMDRWKGKVAIVTGASSGIGAAIAKKLAENGMIVAGLARRTNKIEQLASQLSNDVVVGGKNKRLVAFRCDMGKEDEILATFESITQTLGPVHVLVNNAGIIRNTNMSDGNTDMWKEIFNVNVMGLCIATREAIRIMKSGNVRGHILHINSVLGHVVPAEYHILNAYIGSKFAITGLADTLRFELTYQNAEIKVTNLSPGMVETEIVDAGNMSDILQQAFSQHKILEPEDVADAALYAISTPPHVQIKELTIKPLKERC